MAKLWKSFHQKLSKKLQSAKLWKSFQLQKVSWTKFHYEQQVSSSTFFKKILKMFWNTKRKQHLNTKKLVFKVKWKTLEKLYYVKRIEKPLFFDRKLKVKFKVQISLFHKNSLAFLSKMQIKCTQRVNFANWYWKNEIIICSLKIVMQEIADFS